MASFSDVPRQSDQSDPTEDSARTDDKPRSKRLAEHEDGTQ